ncbi:phospholipase A-2-activating protein [Dendrobium catenatum]|uniref:Dynein assembly factor with WDR repeat domains 1 n=1 Tax=Dendrobium catenatum TaxID=906689 RepID=A0A2I0W1A0_9ASPA|nr:phospholipase A-2-activating protein [Dendrobium catenatum]PKU69435.1 Dynein assembly factor with WDR repeat domains 1 [Dendrobium catenatum]
MALEAREYSLSCELRAHEDDVRGICICDGFGIATSSRDRTVRYWTPDPEKKHSYVLCKTLVGHSSFVGRLAWIRPCERFPDGGIVSGGMDALVLLWDLRTGVAVETMKGHGLQVTGVVVDDNGDIISTSIDCTIRRWRKGCEVELWESHKVAIQAIVRLSSGDLVTGSSDSTIKLWKGQNCQHTFVGHTDTVRDLAIIPDLGILSASHDSSVRLWALTGEVLMEMMGHSSLVYCVDAHPSGLVASGSEDCSLKIWKDGACVQSIEHPGCVWDAKFLENGDVVTACSDGVVRIWTLHGDRIANPLELEAYALELSHYKSSRKKVGGLKLSDLPGLEALKIPGMTNGQTKVIRDGDNGVAYSWNAEEYKWDKIGEVVDGPGDENNRPILGGIQYDYVFDVDIGDGEPVRKLPYNRGDNPYEVADKWLLNENLPLSYRQQIVEFILQNTGQRDFSLDTSFRDPYTGSSAYIPGETSSSIGTMAKPTYKHIPKKGMLLFETAQFDGILKKITAFNLALSAEMEHNTLSLSDPELSRLSAIVNILKDTAHYHSSTFADVDFIILFKVLKSWPVSVIFPVIDILRMLIIHPDGASRLLKHIEQGNDVFLEILKRTTADPTHAGNLLTLIRAITNLFKHLFFSQWLHLHCSEILDTLSNCRPSFNKNVHFAYSTLVLNYSVLLIGMKDAKGQGQILSAALEIAEDQSLDVDSKFRALVAIGSLMLEGVVKSIALAFDVQSIAKEAKSSKDAKIAEVGADIENLLAST